MVFKRKSGKKCGRCGEFKSFDQYNFRDKEHKIMRGICMECENTHKAKWYQKNRKTHIENVGNQRNRRKKDARDFVDSYLASQSCVDCGESNPNVLEFDHIKGRKKSNIGDLVAQGYSIKAIQKEISKCEIRCANCHRIKTAKERGWFRRQ